MDITFSEFEQTIIKKLVSVTDLEKRLLSYYIYDDTDYTAIELDNSLTTVTIHFKSKNVDELKVWDALCETIFLLRKLEINNLIGIYKNPKGTSTEVYDRSKYEKNNNLQIYFSKENGKGYTSGKKGFFYSDLAKDIKRYSASYFYISQTLKDLVSNNYKSPNDIKHIQNKKISWWAIGLSAFIGIVSLIISAIGIYSPPSKEVTIPLNSIHKDISDILLKVDSINSTISEQNKDSVNIKD